MRQLLSFLAMAMLVGAFLQTSQAQDYAISTTGNVLVISDVSGNSDTLTVSEPSAGNIQFAAVGRTFSVDGAAAVADNSGAISLSGINSITVNGGNGNDIINVGAFATALPGLTINGDAGNDVINLNGSITFAPNANLDLDLQNDTVAPGVDAVSVVANANILTSGSGTITIRTSKTISLDTGSLLETVNGGIVLEANQQTVPTAGIFSGIEIVGATVRSTSTGVVSILGTGGDSGQQRYGFEISKAGRVSGGTSGLTLIKGTGGASTSSYNAGIHIQEANTMITSIGSDIRVEGRGGSASIGLLNNGVEVGSSSMITSSGGNVTVVGNGGGTGASNNNYGIYVYSGGQVSAGGTGSVSVSGTGGNATGTANYGVIVANNNSRITSSGGNVSVTGTGGGIGASTYNHGIYILSDTTANSSTLVTAGGNGSVNLNGQGGNPSGTGGNNIGVYLLNSGAAITSNAGPVTVTGTGGSQSSSAINNNGITLDSNTVVTSGGGNISMTGSGGGGTSSSGNRGLQMQGACQVRATGSASLTLNGTGGKGTGNSHGVRLVDPNSSISAVDGSISITGNTTDGRIGSTGSQGFTMNSFGGAGTKVQTTGGGTIAIIADTIAVTTPGVSINAGSNAITLRQKTNGRLINLGSTTDTAANTLELSNAELNAATCGTLNIGDPFSGSITVSAILVPTNYKTLALAANTSFAAAGGFTADIGPTAAIYEKISVTGTVTIASGAKLTMASTGGYVWNGSDTFTMLANDGTDFITGTFTGPTLTNFLGSTLTAAANYTGGTGNDLDLGPPLTALQTWRQTWYGTTANTGLAADAASPYGNGIPNLAVFAFLGPNQNPASVQPGQLPQLQYDGNNLFYSFTEPGGVSGITYSGESCTSLVTSNWQPVADTGTPPQHRFTVPIGGNPQLFLRLRVTNP